MITNNRKINQLKKILTKLEANIDNTPVSNYPDPYGSDIAGIREPVYNEAAQRDIQGNLLPGFNTSNQHFLFFKFKKRAKAKAFLRDITPYVSNTHEVLQFRRINRLRKARIGKEQTFMSSTWMNVAFSHAGIAKLTSRTIANDFGDESFRLGMAERSTYLGDPSAKNARGHNSNWKFGGANNAIDMMLTTASNSLSQLNEFVDLLKALAEAADVELIYEQDAAKLPDKFRDHEHFGFKDGISQPGVRGKFSTRKGNYITPRYIDPSDDRHRYYGKPGQLMTWPGQYLLGEPRQDTEELIAKGSKQSNFPAWAKRGSYVVVRRLRQDVPTFWDFVSTSAKSMNVDSIEFAARLVGRWPSGSPLMRSPKKDLPALGKDAFANNHFLFDDDTTKSSFADRNYPGDSFNLAETDFLAKVCPHFAHIRKVNPRESVTDLGKPEDNLARMILRRGIAYGRPLVGQSQLNQADLKRDRGLMFVCYNASVEDQFEFLQRRWSNSSVQPNQGGQDIIIGQNGSDPGRVREIAYPGGSATVKVKQDFVVPTGGEYFFAPTISALKDVLAK